MRKSKYAIYIAAAVMSLCGCGTAKQTATEQLTQRSIVVIFDNDVHCNIDGYAQFAGYRDAVSDTAWTVTVSCGDYLQGGTHGALSKGQYIIDVMKPVGYDAVTLGNHEFDYKIPRMMELLGQLQSDVICANLVEIATGNNVFKPYVIKQFDGRKVALLGLTTPTTLQTESYAFYDGAHDQAYDLMNLDFYGMVQRHIDAARTDGADYVIAVCHLGEDRNDMNVDSHTLIASTSGIDALLDGHTHNVVHPMWLSNKDGRPVLIAQTGKQFENVGKLVIAPDGKISAQLVPIGEISNVNQAVQHAIDSVKRDASDVIERHVGHSDVRLRILDDQGYQLVRKAETNAGDIVCDAFRVMTGADIAVNNGGGIRNELMSGDITYGDILGMLPYDNYLTMIEVTGDKVVEMLKANTESLPYTDGQFPQVSGIKFTAVVSDHSITDVQVLNKATGEYEPIIPDKKYTLVTTDYCVSGGGMRDVLAGSVLVQDAIMLYSDALVRYVTDVLGGHIGEEYAEPQGRITIKE